MKSKFMRLSKWLVLYSMAIPTAVGLAILLRGSTFTAEGLAVVWVIWAFTVGIWIVIKEGRDEVNANEKPQVKEEDCKRVKP